MTCPLCSSLLSIQKDSHFYDCETCKAIVQDKNHYITADEEKAHYECHNNDVEDVRYQNFTMPITQYVLDTFLPTHKGLDFGSGTGPVISSMLQKKHYDIVQYDPFFAPDERVLMSTYDYIVSCEVFEHFHHPKVEIDRLVGLLKPNGLLLVMTLLYTDSIDFKTWHYRKDPTHIFIYRAETIAYIAKEKGLEILELTNRFIVLRKTN
ncbi:class I SAM-dependent methyltransferase [uncultured Dokdonia sp.]|uniref:class I SAM-dependent methyltransferase n=1 Tax=uncultured Dokdonia sp. TaxID=575653 RepID=UPI0026147A90|nr:class I SAM-dependent methyltransferase [uncultured Dokdonia sp.]